MQETRGGSYSAAFGAGAAVDAITQARPLLDAVLDHTVEHCTGQSLYSQLDTVRRNAHVIAAAPPTRQADAIQRLARDTDLSSGAITQVVTTAIHTTTPPWRHRSTSTAQV